MAHQELSKFFSEDGKKTATLYRAIKEPKHFYVSAKSDSGTIFQAIFDTLTDAEHFAEDWVLAK